MDFDAFPRQSKERLAALVGCRGLYGTQGMTTLTGAPAGLPAGAGGGAEPRSSSSNARNSTTMQTNSANTQGSLAEPARGTGVRTSSVSGKGTRRPGGETT